MTKPKLSAKTPDEEDLNSLKGDHENLLDHPRGTRIAVVEYVVRERVLATAGDATARIELVHFEGLDVRGLDSEGRKLLDKAFKKRTGKANRPEPDPELDFGTLDEGGDSLGSVTPIGGTPAE